MRTALALLLLAGCGPQLTQPPAEPVSPPREPAPRVLLGESGQLIEEPNPFAPRASRRADYDLNATLVARDVALVVEPAAGAPIYVSNRLGAALVRRFAGHLLLKEALGAERVFLIQPVVSPDALTQSGLLVVDWRIRAEEGGDVGAIYAQRRVSGAVTGADPWSALTNEDVELIALQTAAHLIEAPAIRDALAAAAAISTLERTPTPAARPFGEAGGPAPRTAPRPAKRPTG